MQDLRLAIRSLRAAPIVTAVAILSLALGIGANTAIFSFINGLLLRALPVSEPQRLAALSAGPTLARQQFNYPTLAQLRRQTQLFDGALAYNTCCGKAALTVGGDTQMVDRHFVSGDFFSTLGVPALLGRMLTPADDVPGGGPDGPTMVISYGLWQRRFGGAANIVGTRVSIERVSVMIVGITPADFYGVEVGKAFDVVFPIKIEPIILSSIPFGEDVSWLNIMVRLKPGLSLDAATTGLRAMQPQIRDAATPQKRSGETQGLRPTEFLKAPFTLHPAFAGTSALRQQFREPLVAIFVVVALVLIIACANIANVQFARGTARRHELSLRLALGASRWRLMRQLLAESVVVAAAGAVLGLLFAAWASRAAVAQLSTSGTPVMLDVSLDWRVLSFTAAAMIVTALLFGVAPAARATRVAPIDALKEHGGGASGGTGGTFSGSLVVAQVAVSLVLVVTAGLFIRTFEELARVSLGFDRDRVLVVTVTAPTIPATERNPFYHRLVDTVAALPGVARAGGSMWQPLTATAGDYIVVSLPGTEPSPDAPPVALNTVTPGWLGAYGTAIRAGRDVDEHDTARTRRVMVVNEAFARRLFPGQRAVGMTLSVAAHEPGLGDVPLGSITVVGVAADAVYRSIREPAPPTIYFPLAQNNAPLLQTYFYIAARSSTNQPALLTRSIATALVGVNRDLALTFRPLVDQVSATIAPDRLLAMLSAFFGALALLLASLGLYGVTAYAVARRRAEIGIRMALGAAPAQVMGLVLERVLLLVGLGVALGAGASLWASKFVATLLFGLAPRDSMTLVGAAIALAAVGAVAGGLPAWRASRIDPAGVLRDQ